MITRKNKERLMALCPGHAYQRTAMNEALLALWAVRVIDNWSKKHGRVPPAPRLVDKGTSERAPEFRIGIAGYEVDGIGFKARTFSGATADMARAVLAENLTIEDLTLDPMPGLFDT